VAGSWYGTEAGKIWPAGIVCHLLPTCHASI
jgi:hypothetical protein